MAELKVFISGTKYFGECVLRLCLNCSGVSVVGVCCPIGDQYIGKLAATYGIPIIPAGSLNYDTMPAGVDLGITAHSFDYIGKKTRYKTTYGWIGYHPSLLPRHRGRSAIEWAIRMRDPITGGTVFWLNSGIDRGDIAYQKWCFIEPKLFSIDPKIAAKELWSSELLKIGIELLDLSIKEIGSGVIRKTPQDARFSTFEPSTNISDVYKPDLLMLEN